MMEPLRHWKLIASALILLSVLAVTGPRQSVIPGFEGLDAGVEGVYLRRSFYELGDSLPQGVSYDYEWGDASPRSTILRGRAGLVSDWGGVRVEVGRPQTVSDPFMEPRMVDYWVKDGAEYLHVKGQIMVYTVPLTFSVRREGGAFQYVFQGEKVWFSLVSVAWNRAVQENSPVSGETGYGKAWEAPLAAVITGYTVTDPGDHYQLDPSEQGRDIVLYDSRSQSGVISDLDWRGDLNASLEGDVRPDTRLHRTAFFPVTLTDWGLTTGLWWSNAPVADYSLKVYTLRIGEYTYTNPDDTPWAERDPESNAWENFQDWMAETVNAIIHNPLIWVIIAGVILLIGLGLMTGILGIAIRFLDGE